MNVTFYYYGKSGKQYNILVPETLCEALEVFHWKPGDDGRCNSTGPKGSSFAVALSTPPARTLPALARAVVQRGPTQSQRASCARERT